MKSYLTKNQSIFLLVFILVLGSLILANPAQAGWFGDAVAQLIGWIVYAFVYVIGLILILVMWVLIKIAQYNDFIYVAPVEYGWTIVRDLCNMFFILILLIIAFATILRVERYSFKKLLPKLILMAVLINFSKLICGILIDFTQVIMLTFVNGFKDIGSGNLTNMLGIDKIMSLDTQNSKSDESAVTSWSIVGAYMLALIYSVIALITIITMLAMLAMRMIMIWVYVVLSPMAYLLAAFPAGESYSKDWWTQFSSNLIIGPVLAFFIWLSFVSLGGVSAKPETDPVAIISKTGKTDSGVGSRVEVADSSDPKAAITEAGSPDHMIKFIISIAMLVGGMQIAQKIAGQTGGAMGKVMEKTQKMGYGAVKSAGVGLKRATGIERVQNAYKSYKDMKSSERSTQARNDALKANEVIGKGKQAVAGAIKFVPEKTSGVIAERITGSKKTIRAAEAEKTRIEETAKPELENIKNERIDKTAKLNNVERELSSFDQNRSGGRNKILQDTSISGVVKADMLAKYDAETAEKKKPLEGSKAKLSGEIKALNEKETAIKSGSQAQIAAEDQKISAAKDRQERTSKVVGTVMAVAGGAMLGSVAGPLGVVAGGFGGYKVKNKVEHAGEANLRRAAGYNTKKISEKKEEMKDMGKDKILDTVKNTRDDHEHAAATAIALENGYFDKEIAAAETQKVRNRFKGDSRVNTTMDNAAAKNYNHLAGPYATLANNNATPEERKEANSKITSGLQNGSIDISKISGDSIGLAMEAIVDGLKDKDFRKQYDNSSDAQQNTIKAGLQRQIDISESAGNHEQAFNAKRKLAYSNGLNMDDFGPSSNLDDPTQKRNHEQKKEFLGTVKNDDLKKALTNDNSSKQFVQEIKVNLEAGGMPKINAGTSVDEIRKQLQTLMPNAGFNMSGRATNDLVESIKDQIINPS